MIGPLHDRRFPDCITQAGELAALPYEEASSEVTGTGAAALGGLTGAATGTSATCQDGCCLARWADGDRARSTTTSGTASGPWVGHRAASGTVTLSDLPRLPGWAVVYGVRGVDTPGRLPGRSGHWLPRGPAHQPPTARGRSARWAGRCCDGDGTGRAQPRHRSAGSPRPPRERRPPTGRCCSARWLTGTAAGCQPPGAPVPRRSAGHRRCRRYRQRTATSPPPSGHSPAPPRAQLPPLGRRPPLSAG